MTRSTQHRRTRLAVPIGLLAALALVAAACSDSMADPSAAEDTTTTAMVTTTEATTTTAPAQDEADDTETDGDDADQVPATPDLSLVLDTVAGRQLEPLMIGVLDDSLTEADVTERLSETFLESISAEQFIGLSGQVRALLGASPAITELTLDTDFAIAGTMVNPDDGTEWRFGFAVEAHEPHRAVEFGITQPQDPAPLDGVDSLEAAAEAWQALAPEAALLVTTVPDPAADPAVAIAACDSPEIGGDGAAQPLSIGSAFKFYVLAAVVTAVENGTLTWDDPASVQEELKSLPSGLLQVSPAGTEVTVAQAAELMMGLSDNTATDHLLALVGREAVAAELVANGHRAPELNDPFLTTRELFQLKLGPPERLAEFATAGADGRRAVLAELAAEPLPELSPGDFTVPNTIEVEWLASTGDLCRAIVSLFARSADHPELLAALTANSGLTLDRTRYPVIAFKGGSEPGVLSLTWLVTSADGSIRVVSGILNDPDTALDQLGALGAMASVFEVLDR